MPNPLVQQFIDALGALERDADVEPLARLYAPDSTLRSSAAGHQFDGPEGARSFWAMYRDSFGAVSSEFRSIIEDGGRAALEWVSRGADAEGDPFTYEGVTVLEFNGDRIGRFHTYFNPTQLKLRAGTPRSAGAPGPGDEAAQVTDTSYARPGSTVH
jgi:hypothetical protein